MMAAFVLLLYYLRDIVIMLLLSVFISIALGGAVRELERFKIPRIVGTIIIFLVVILSIAFVIYAIVPIAILEINSLLNSLDGTLGNVIGEETISKIRNVINPDLNHLASILLAGSASFFDVVGKFLGGAAHFLFVFILAFYMTASRDGVQNFIRSIFPGSVENKMVKAYERISEKISKWFYAQIILSLIVGVAVFIGLTLLGVRYSMTLALVAAVFELIPIIGPTFAGAVAILIAATDSLNLGFYTFIFFIVIQQLESNILVPVMVSKAINIHPVFVIVSVLGGLQLAGVVGMLLAIPVALIAQEIFEDWVLKKTKSVEEITV